MGSSYWRVFLVLITILSIQLSAASVTNNSSQFSVNIAFNATVGNYITNSTGFALYIYTRDTPYSGNSTCYVGCANTWRPFYAANITVPQGLNKSSFGTITRNGVITENGNKQTTYEGRPLYLFIGDKAPGEINGQGSQGAWYLIGPSGPVMLASEPVTTIITNEVATSVATTSIVQVSNGSGQNVQSGQQNQPSNNQASSNLSIYGAAILVIIIVAILFYASKRKKLSNAK